MTKINGLEEWEKFPDSSIQKVREVAYKNEIARARDKFTVQEAKLFHIILSKIKTKKKNDTVIVLNKKELFDDLGLTGDDRYRRYRDLIKNMKVKTSLEFTDPTNNDEYCGAVVVSSRWNKGKSEVYIGLDPLLMPYIEQLAETGRFTTVFLESILKFNSKHAIKLYQWCKSWSQGFESARYITTQELKEMMSISDTEYIVKGKFHRSSFEKNTVDRAIMEINAKTELRIEYNKTKKHGIVIRYNFHIFDLGKDYDNDSLDVQLGLFDGQGA